jgi:hypothetical protein
MIARKACLFSRNPVSRAVASSQSWMTLIDRGCEANRARITEQPVKGTHRG